MERFTARHGSVIQLGRAGESGVRQIIFPLQRFVHLGAGEAALVITLPGDDRRYPVPVRQEARGAVWTVTAAETARAGYGQAQLSYLVEHQVAKTEVYDTWVEPSVGDADSPTPPAEQQGWVDQVLTAGASAATHADRAALAAQQAVEAAAGVADIRQQVEQVQEAAKQVSRDKQTAAGAAVQAGQAVLAATAAQNAAEAAERKADQHRQQTGLDRQAVEQAAAQVGQTVEDKLTELEQSGRFQGEDGRTPHFDTVTATALPAGAQPTAQITGAIEHLTLELGIPQGQPGEGGSGGQNEIVTQSYTVEEAVASYHIPIDLNQQIVVGIAAKFKNTMKLVAVQNGLGSQWITFAKAGVMDGKVMIPFSESLFILEHLRVYLESFRYHGHGADGLKFVGDLQPGDTIQIKSIRQTQ